MATLSPGLSPTGQPYRRRTVWAWSLYDFANSTFTTLVVTFIYATYFTQAIAADEIRGTELWTRGVSLTALFVIVLSPFLGAYADRTGARKRFLLFTTVVCILATAGLFFPGPGEVLLALTLFVIANVAYELSFVFYNAYLPEIAPPDKIGRVSGYGWALGYVGGLLALVVALVVLVQPETAPFGLDQATGEHIRATNLLVAGWFALFSVPTFLVLRESAPAAPPQERSARSAFSLAFSELRRTFGEIRRYRQIVRLLAARLFYNDGLTTVFQFGGIYAAGTFGFSFEQILFFGITLNVAAGVGAFLFGFVDDRIGGRRTIMISLGLLASATALAVFAQSEWQLWVAGILIGVASGPNQAASRSLMGRFVPPNKENEFYGFFSFSGKLAAFFGPIVFGLATAAFASQRAGVASILLFFVAGALLLLRVDEAEGIRLARAGTTEA
ncbi:MAG: MFS transporter [Rubricoccaceae bacterium]